MIKRYDFKAVLPGRFRKAERKRGEYVKFSDHESEMEKQRDEFVQFLKQTIENACAIKIHMIGAEIKRLESHQGEKGRV